jgi:glycosyltransferase involved in cell wall biosynthesis
MLVNVTIPVCDEEIRLPRSLPRLHRFLREHCRFEFEIVIADNASNDRTPAIAQGWASRHPEVRVLRLEQKGRGRALREAWSGSPAEVPSYMDVDLSSDLMAFPALIEALAGGGYDLATGSRLLKPSLTTRGLKREILSRGYNRLVRVFCGTRFTDAHAASKRSPAPLRHGYCPESVTTAGASTLDCCSSPRGWVTGCSNCRCAGRRPGQPRPNLESRDRG